MWIKVWAIRQEYMWLNLSVKHESNSIETTAQLIDLKLLEKVDFKLLKKSWSIKRINLESQDSESLDRVRDFYIVRIKSLINFMFNSC